MTKSLLTLLVSFLFGGSAVFGATVLTTNSSDTIGTFRTNVNTSLTNLNTSLGALFTSTTNYGAVANSTSTPMWFTGGLQASSTSHFVYASTTVITVGSTTPSISLITSGFDAVDCFGAYCFKIKNASSGNVFRLFDNDAAYAELHISSGNNVVGAGAYMDFYADATFAYLDAGTTLSNRKILIQTTNDSYILSQDDFGYGTSTPWAKFSLHANSNDTVSKTLFAIASSTLTATSTLFTVNNIGQVGIGSSTPGYMLSIASSTVRGTAEATTTLYIDSASTKGTCIQLKDADGAGYSYIVANNGVLTVGTASCK